MAVMDVIQFKPAVTDWILFKSQSQILTKTLDLLSKQDKLPSLFMVARLKANTKVGHTF